MCLVAAVTVSSEVSQSFGEAETVVIEPPTGLILVPDEVPHQVQAPHPSEGPLPASVSPRGPPVVSSQQIQLHLDEVQLLLIADLDKRGLLNLLTVDIGLLPGVESCSVEQETAKIQERGIEPSSLASVSTVRLS